MWFTQANVTLKCLGDDATTANSAPFLQDEIISLKGLEVIAEQPEPIQSAPEPAAASAVPSPVVQESKPSEKKPAKPKWFKMWFPIHIYTVMLNLVLAPVGELQHLISTDLDFYKQSFVMRDQSRKLLNGV